MPNLLGIFKKLLPPIFLLVSIKTIYGENNSEGRKQRLRTLERAVLSYFNVTALGCMRTAPREGFWVAQEGSPALLGGWPRTPAGTWPPPPFSQPILDAFLTPPVAQPVPSARQARAGAGSGQKARASPVCPLLRICIQKLPLDISLAKVSY